MSRRSFFFALLSLTLLVSVGVAGFILLEEKSFLNALWMTVASITGVGFGDMVPHTVPGKIIDMVLMVAGLGLFTYVLGTLVVGLVEGRLGNLWGRKKMKQAINNLQDHIVLCGAGRVGREVLTQLKYDGSPFVVIERDPAFLEMLQAEGVLHIAGDATEDRVLLEAGANRARAVITTLPEDAGNLLITIACRDFNPSARIIARANRPEGIPRLKRAGADCVISPAAIAGNRMALAALKPASVALVQTLIEKPGVSLELEEMLVCAGAPMDGEELRHSRLKEDYDTQLLAIVRGEETLVNPKGTEVFRPGDLLIVFGPAEKISQLEPKVCQAGEAEK
ncbi:potassium channel family protein [Desulfotomaculum copahuensis]|uniref:Potassium channel protein n=1 Tax=Desulfotomaculum copahuensis TaxID=1838280 RepID=A0A1B7LHV5_9FIRM|nr:potassium channel protein [Desulfotomaculum copahuensis]OAT85764.1 hypothetical protein A6M21_04515 [Desulfotomaculum copahuensis]